MGCVGSCIASCAGSCIGGCCAKCCSSCGESSSKARLPYLIILFIGTVLSVVLRYWGHPILINNRFIDISICDSQCMGFEAAYRISFVLFVFFLFHALPLSTCKGTMKVHTSHWLLKLVGLIVLLVVSFFIPNDFFDVYSNIARFVSGIFLLIQIIILIDFAYGWNESWMADDREWTNRILFCALLMIAASITICVFAFRWFTNGHCTRNQFFIGWTITITVVFTLISITERVKHGALLPSAVVMLYCFYTLYSALASDPSSCNSLEGTSTIQVVFGIIIAGFSVCYAGWNLSNSKSLFDDGEEEEPQLTPLQDSATKDSATADPESHHDVQHAHDDHDDKDKEESAQLEFTRKRNGKFHLVMAAASMYLAMLVTNWGDSGGSDVSYDMGETTVWIKIVSQWLTMLLYTWSLVAPLACPDRFDDEDS